MESCPHCGKEIPIGARRCKHCGEFLSGEQAVTAVDAKYNRKNCIWQFMQLIVFFVIFQFLFLKIIPTFTAIFAAGGIGLPLLTQFTITISRILRMYSILISIFIILPLVLVASIFAFGLEKYRATIKSFIFLKWILIIVNLIAFVSIYLPMVYQR